MLKRNTFNILIALVLAVGLVNAYLSAQPTNYFEMGDALGIDSVTGMAPAQIDGTPVTSSVAVLGNSTYFGGTSRAFYYNGSSTGFSSIPMSNSNSWSVNVWIRKPAVITSNHYVIHLGYDAGNRMGFRTSNNKYEVLYLDSSANGHYMPMTSNYLANTWYMLTAVFNDATDEVYYYVNSNLNHTDTDSDLYDPPINEFAIGRSIFGGGWLQGYVDELTFFDYALNTNEISYLYGGGTPPSYPYALGDSYVYLSFYDQETVELINTTNITVRLIGPSFSEETITSNGTVSFEEIQNGAYTIIALADNYTTTYDYIELNSEVLSQTVYMLKNDSADKLLVRVLDFTGTAKEGAVVKLQRYYIDSNSYVLVNSQLTDIQGETNFYFTPETVFYRFIVEVNDEVVLITTPKYIDSSYSNNADKPYILQYSESENILVNYYGATSIAYNLSFNSSSNNFRFFYNDADNLVTQGCLYLYRQSGSATNLINSSCENSSSSTILLASTAINGSTWVASAYVTYEGDTFLLDSLMYKYPESVSFSGTALFMLIVLTMVVSLMFLWSPAIAMVLLPVPLLVFSLAGLVNIPVSIPIVVLTMAFVVGYQIRK